MNQCDKCIHEHVCEVRRGIGRVKEPFSYIRLMIDVTDCELYTSTPQLCYAKVKPLGTTTMHTCHEKWRHQGDHICDECKKTFAQIKEEAKPLSYKDKLKQDNKPLPPAKQGNRYASAEQLTKIYQLPHAYVSDWCLYFKKTGPLWLTREQAERLIKEAA